MQLYHGTYLTNGEFTIPKELFSNGNFFKYPELYIYGVITKDFNPNESVLSDAIQIFITPYSFDKLKNIYWFELSMPNIKGAFWNFLKKFEENKFNILDCRGVDTAEESTGKVELIAKYEGRDEANKKLKIFKDKNITLKQSFKNQSITNSRKYKCLVSDKIVLEQIKSEREVESKVIEEYKIVLKNSLWKNLRQQINNHYKNCYLSITSFSEGNFITVKFKSLKELIAPLRIKFTCNKEGLLLKIIESLRDIGVNLKLINSQKLDDNSQKIKDNPIVYDISFDIANTKLEGYDQTTIERLINAHIDSNDITVSIVEDEIFNPGRKNLPDDLENELLIFISDKSFKNDIIDGIKSVWKNRLLGCIGNCNNITNKCFLKKTTLRKDFEALLDKIENSIIKDDIDVSILKKTISKYNSNGYCGDEIKGQLINFYSRIQPYIDDFKNVNQNTPNPSNVVESGEKKDKIPQASYSSEQKQINN